MGGHSRQLPPLSHPPTPGAAEARAHRPPAPTGLKVPLRTALRPQPACRAGLRRGGGEERGTPPIPAVGPIGASTAGGGGGRQRGFPNTEGSARLRSQGWEGATFPGEGIAQHRNGAGVGTAHTRSTRSRPDAPPRSPRTARSAQHRTRSPSTVRAALSRAQRRPPPPARRPAQRSALPPHPQPPAQLGIPVRTAAGGAPVRGATRGGAGRRGAPWQQAAPAGPTAIHAQEGPGGGQPRHLRALEHRPRRSRGRGPPCSPPPPGGAEPPGRPAPRCHGPPRSGGGGTVRTPGGGGGCCSAAPRPRSVRPSAARSLNPRRAALLRPRLPPLLLLLLPFLLPPPPPPSPAHSPGPAAHGAPGRGRGGAGGPS